MDLRTFLFVNRISIGEFAKELGMDRSAFWKIAMRGSRPTRWMPYIISHMTGGQVTVDELCNPCKYPVNWKGDQARSDCKRFPRPIKPRQGVLDKFKNFLEDYHGQANQKRQKEDRQNDGHASQEGHSSRQEAGEVCQDGQKEG